MENNLTGSADVICPEVMGTMIGAKILAQAKFTPYAKVDTTLQGVPGDKRVVAAWTYIGDAEEVEEGEEVSTTVLAASSVVFPIKKAMKSVSITQEAVNSGLGNPVGQAETQLAKAIMSKVDTDLLEAAYTSSNTVTQTDAISYIGIVDAITKFEDEEDGIEKVMFIHPDQEASLLKDEMFLSADRFEAGVAVRGSVGKIAGCWIKKSKKVQKTENGYLCPIIKLEADSPETEYTEDEVPALTIFLKQEVQVDAEWYPKRQVHDITACKYYGVALTNESKVVLAAFGV